MANNIERVTFDLPADIIFDVLSRLPVKSLIRFKSVCKLWYTLIESRNFVNTHEKMQPNIELEPNFNNLIVTGKGPGNRKKCSLLHLSEDSRNLIGMELSYLSSTEDCVMVGVCNGLVCVGFSYNSPDFIICNPTTGQFRRTPEYRLSKTEDDLIFLGFCLDANGYEIFRIIFTTLYGTKNEMPGIRAEIYTMFTDTWSETDVKLGENPWLEYCHARGQDFLDAVVISGIFYWKAGYFDGDGDGDPFVTYFDKCKNVFDVINAPWDVYAGSGWQLHEIKEELGLIIYHCYYKFDLLVMNEDMDWTKIHKFDLSRILCFPSNWDVEIRVIGSTTNGELVLLNRYENNLRLYDPISEETKCLHSVGFEGVIDDAYFYTPSLTPVN